MSLFTIFSKQRADEKAAAQAEIERQNNLRQNAWLTQRRASDAKLNAMRQQLADLLYSENRLRVYSKGFERNLHDIQAMINADEELIALGPTLHPNDPSIPGRIETAKEHLKSMRAERKKLVEEKIPALLEKVKANHAEQDKVRAALKKLEG